MNLLRLQGAQQTIQGVLYLVEDKTRDVTLRKELIGANAAKDQFLALLSHELRNPLSPVIAMVGELEATTPDSPETRRRLEIIRRNVELEARLIDDLLDITRISKGKLQLTFEVANVHEILQRAYEICREEIEAKNQHVEFRLRAEQTYVDGDPARLQQVFWNLIKNAVKFTPSDGRIVIETLNPTPDKIEIKITDTGIGIEEARLEQSFQRVRAGSKLDHATIRRSRTRARDFQDNGGRARGRNCGRERRQRQGSDLYRYAQDRRSSRPHALPRKNRKSRRPS